jgi:hypothetical protein
MAIQGTSSFRAQAFRAFARPSLTTVLLTLLGSCDAATTETPPMTDVEREAAVAHAMANVQLQQQVATARAKGWNVGASAEVKVERFTGPLDSDAPVSESNPAVVWTRVPLPLVRPAALGANAVIVDAIVAWPERGRDVFALAPRGQATDTEVNELAAPPEAVADEDLLLSADEPAPAAAAAACGRQGNACGGVTKCCRGLRCTETRDNHFTCYCAQPLTVHAPMSKTSSSACVGGLAKVMRHWTGCTCCDWSTDGCGRGIGIPQYVGRRWDTVVCGGMGC